MLLENTRTSDAVWDFFFSRASTGSTWKVLQTFWSHIHQFCVQGQFALATAGYFWCENTYVSPGSASVCSCGVAGGHLAWGHLQLNRDELPKDIASAQ